MKYCDLTLPSPEENLACDEVLLDWCEAGLGEELLRFWEPTQYFVVLGYANQAATEANLEFCGRHGIPILRRCSGGGTVLQGPGCLNYSLILRIEGAVHLRAIREANEFIMQCQREAFSALLKAPVEKQGFTDLAIGGLKFSGNAQRRHKRFLLFHGCFLLNLDLGLMEKVLPMPSRRPHYRADRAHTEFLMNINAPPPLIKTALASTWRAEGNLGEIPLDLVTSLARRKYAGEEWNLKF